MSSNQADKVKISEGSVFLYGDDAPYSNNEFITRLKKISESNEIANDSYSIGGEVGKLESAMAKRLGKEASVFFPTGTLANHVAIRQLCLPQKRAIVPEQSHIYQDSGDSVQQLSGVNLVPLGSTNPYFSLDELKESLNASISGRVVNPVGVVVIESPVRRCYGRLMPYEDMKAITGYCRELGIPTHLDGARLFIASSITQVPLQKYSHLFDTVYISMWKYFRAPYGAILAGSKEFCENLFHIRRMFGGSLPSASISASLALDGLELFESNVKMEVDKSNAFLDALNKLPHLEVSRYPDGSNIVPVKFSSTVDLQKLEDSLSAEEVFINTKTSTNNTIHLTINLTVLRKSNDELLKIFSNAIKTAAEN